jgi:hypothetical protein
MIPRLLITVFILALSSGALSVPASAANPCSVRVQRHQLDAQKHQIDLQMRAINFQYPGPANAAYRENLRRQLEMQKRQIDFQKHQLDAQQRQCETAYHPHKFKHKHHKDKDHDRDDY